MSRTYVESHVNFGAIGADIASTEPAKITAEELLERLAPQILTAHGRGVTAEQIRDRLKAHKIQVSVAVITRFIDGKMEAAAKPATRKSPASTGDRQGDLAIPPG